MISPKQKKILAFPFSGYDALICDGAVRSGKTSLMMWAFVGWAMREFNGQRFGICGKTVDAACKNIVVPFLSMTLARQRYTLRWRRADKVLEVRRGGAVNFFEVFGGKDESSFALIQGRTLAGVLLDEVALMPQSFVNQALARCSVGGSKLWFSCNPGNPNHWFYCDWISRPEEHNALYLHFCMEDNPALSQKTLERYQSMYTGLFYKRYVQGLWVPAEGLVYADCFGEANIVDEPPAGGEYYISVDYGTQNPFASGLWCVTGAGAVMVREYYYDGRKSQRQKTDSEYYADLEAFAGDLDIEYIVVDPSAASFKTEIRKQGRFAVRNAKNDVLDGIRLTANLIKSGRVKFCRGCVHTLEEFGLYSWDTDAAQDAVIKENDHCMDAVRYMCATVLRSRF